MTVDQEYYYLNNPSHYVNQVMLKMGMNMNGFFRYMKDIVNTKISQFNYEGIEGISGLTSTILEEALMFKGRLCFFKPNGYGWMLGYYTPINEYDIYHRPITVDVYTFNEKCFTNIPYKDIILVRDNAMDIPPILVIKEYVDKIIDIEGKMDKMLTIGTLPLVMVADKKLANQLKETAKKLGNPNPFIAGDDKLINTVQSFNIDVPIKPAEVYAIRKKYINECMASIGVYAVEAKKERLVVSEIMSQNDYTDFIYQGMVNERHKFITEMNKRGGFNIKLVETYDLTQEANIEETAKRAAEILRQEAEAIKKVDPTATFGGTNPVKVTEGGGKNG